MIITVAASAAVNSAVNAAATAATANPLTAAAVGAVTTGLAVAKIASMAVPECRKFHRQVRNLRSTVRRKLHAWSSSNDAPLSEGEIIKEVRQARRAAAA